MLPNQKLFVVVREDLSPGQQAVQAMHAAIEWTQQQPDSTKEWHTTSNYLAFLSVPDQYVLEELTWAAYKAGVQYVEFFEPDLENSLTAVVLEPTEEASRLCKELPLALRRR